MLNAHQTLLLWEWLAGFVAVILVLSFVLAFLYGRETVRARKAISELGDGTEYFLDMLWRHFWFVMVFLSSLVIAIGVIEHMASLARAAGSPTPLDLPHVVHYAFDFYFFVRLGQVLWYNGYRSTKHNAYVYKLVVPGAGVLLTGTYLYVQFCLTH